MAFAGLDVVLLRHYASLYDGVDVSEVIGVASNFRSDKIGRFRAFENAIFTYAQNTRAYIQGRV